MQILKNATVFLLILVVTTVQAQTNVRDVWSLDRNWKFHLGSASDPAKDFNYGIDRAIVRAGEAFGPIKPGFNDSSWRSLDVPHDWAVEQDFGYSMKISRCWHI